MFIAEAAASVEQSAATFERVGPVVFGLVFLLAFFYRLQRKDR